jgi:hypothetical protein
VCTEQRARSALRELVQVEVEKALWVLTGLLDDSNDSEIIEIEGDSYRLKETKERTAIKNASVEARNRRRRQGWRRKLTAPAFCARS